jgi:GPI mannosyltransferase 1 subunit M
MWIVSQVCCPLLLCVYIILLTILKAFWLHQGFQLEFMGLSTFLPGLWLASLGFFIVNCWILGVIVSDIGKWPAKEKDVRGVVQKNK